MRLRPALMTAAIVALAATGLVGCRAPEPPSASSSSSSVAEETAALDVCAGPAGAGLEGKIAFSSDRTGNYEIFVVNADCRGVAQLTHSPSADYHPAWSPDGTRIAFASSDGGDDIFVMNADGSGRTRLTAEPGDDHEASWSPDGTKIAFTSNRTGNYEMFVMNADGTDVTRLTDTPTDEREPAWSPEGTRIAFSGGGTGGHGSGPGTGNYDIFVVNAAGGALSRLTRDPAHDQNPAWSPDGTKIAWERDRGGAGQLLVMNADASAVVRLTSDADVRRETRGAYRDWSPDGSPAWSPDGTRIAFSSKRTGNTEILVVKADGSGMTKLTDHPACDDEPAWQPRMRRLPATPAPLPATPPLPATT